MAQRYKRVTVNAMVVVSIQFFAQVTWQSSATQNSVESEKWNILRLDSVWRP